MNGTIFVMLATLACGVSGSALAQANVEPPARPGAFPVAQVGFDPTRTTD